MKQMGYDGMLVSTPVSQREEDEDTVDMWSSILNDGQTGCSNKSPYLLGDVDGRC